MAIKERIRTYSQMNDTMLSEISTILTTGDIETIIGAAAGGG